MRFRSGDGLGDEVGHDAPQGLVAIVVVLELLQFGHHGVPAALGDADGEHDEEGVEAGLLDDDAVLGQVFGEDGGGDAPVGEVAVHVQAGGDDGGLDGVQQVEFRRQVAEAVPVLAGAQHPVFPAAHALVGQFHRAPDLEPPVGARIGFHLRAHLAHGAAEIQGLGDGFLHQGGAAGLLHHGRGHVAGRDDGVLGAGGGVHEEGFVEHVRSSFRVSDSCTRIWEAWDRPASSLWVDWVENTMDSLQRGRSTPMACMPR
jgi:hypothetical protein